LPFSIEKKKVYSPPLASRNLVYFSHILTFLLCDFFFLQGSSSFIWLAEYNWKHVMYTYDNCRLNQRLSYRVHQMQMRDRAITKKNANLPNTHPEAPIHLPTFSRPQHCTKPLWIWNKIPFGFTTATSSRLAVECGSWRMAIRLFLKKQIPQTAHFSAG